jgi:glucans biosynthesis protein
MSFESSRGLAGVVLIRIDRRQCFALGAGLLAFAGGGGRAWSGTTGLSFGPARPFSFDRLRARARALAAAPYAEPPRPAATVVQDVDFDAIQKIKFRADRALWADGPGALPVRFFHLDRFNGQPVAVHAVDGDAARTVLYEKDDFSYGDPALAARLPDDLGFSGFRVMDGRGSDIDWVAFQGASYFRSCGPRGQYGTSARGIAIDTALPRPEEFPRFSQFWLEETADASDKVTVFALLEGPSVTGAYRIEATRGRAVVMTVRAEVFARTNIARLGLAPLTSMFWYGENNRRSAIDWRPEVHDCDGLAMWTGKGEHIWRPLIDPPSVLTNSFVDTDPKGFGLLQRDHSFDDYQDDGAFYDRRPSVWVEPIGRWGEGAVQLVEIPTDDEIHDNIVAYWTPKAPVKAGDTFAIDYRLYWQDDEPHPTDLARVVATRIGRGGVPGQPVPPNRWKFVIDFAGGPLATMAPRYDVKPVLTLSQGEVHTPYVVKVVGTDRWRAFFDVALQDRAAIDMRCYLRLGDRTLSETWLYQFYP